MQDTIIIVIVIPRTVAFYIIQKIIWESRLKQFSHHTEVESVVKVDQCFQIARSENSFLIINISFITRKMTLNYNWCNYFKLHANWKLVLVINWNSIFQKHHKSVSSSDSNNQDQHINDFKTNCYGHVEVVVEKWDSKFCLLFSLLPKEEAI